MAMSSDSTRIGSPLSIVRGSQVEAAYTEQLIPEYQSNPLVEALPPLWAMEDVERMLSYFPNYDPGQRQLPDEIRLRLLENAREFFIPQGVHYEIHLSISNMLRRGYIDRNPAERGMWPRQAAKMEELRYRLQSRAFLGSKARGLCIVGLSGVGKTTAVENILSLYPQVITHTSYKGQDLILKQLVWVKLHCPSDGSLKGLCLNYLEEVDDILGTNYVSFYGVKRRSIDELLLIMGRVASNHFQGVIVFDEIQDLSDAKSGGAVRMLNFFVQMENILGIPFVLIATPKARALLSGEFRQARRISEQGDIFWRRMSMTTGRSRSKGRPDVDPDWNDFVRAMWRYWYLKKDHQLPKYLLADPVIKTLYDASKGITALVVTIFFLAQRRAIISQIEDLTKNVIESTVHDNQYFVSQVLAQLKEEPQGSRDHGSASDLERPGCQVRRTAAKTDRGDEEEKGQDDTRSPKGRVEETSYTTSPSVKSGKGHNPPKPAATAETLDFRSLKTRLASEGSPNLSDVDSCFGSIEEFT